MLRRTIGGLCVTLALVCSANAQSDPQLSEQIEQQAKALIKEAQNTDLGYDIVAELTTRVGARLGGSEKELEARNWAVAKLEEFGFENVRDEQFEIDYWARNKERAQIISPSVQDLYVTMLGGSPSTPEGGVQGEIVRFESVKELVAAPADSLKHKIVFLDEKMVRTQDGAGYGLAVGKRYACGEASLKAGAKACLIRSVGTQTRRFPHTGMTKRATALEAAPSAALSPPDADQLARLMAYGPVRVELVLEADPIVNEISGNVVAEIPGREAPEEIVVIGGHLDSWDLGTGAVDDGAGVAITMAAAKLINDLPKKPRRTIRLVLWGSEEVGLLGARAYTNHHAEELDNHIMAAESDFGAGQIWRIDSRFGEGAEVYRDAIQSVLAPLGVANGNNTATGGPDASMLMRAGVPVVSLRQNGWDYFDLHHTPDDTLDKIDPADMRQNVAAYAAFAYIVAETEWDFRGEAGED